MKILVIGGTNFIGPMLVQKLLEKHWEVTVYNRGSKTLPFNGSIKAIRGDRTDYEQMKSDLSGINVDAIVDMIPMNGGDSRAVVEIFDGRISASVHISSGDVYARGLPVPISEDAPTEEPLYAKSISERIGRSYSKIEVEKVVMDANKRNSFPATVLRLPQVYGPNDPMMREWYFIKRALDEREHIIFQGNGLNLFHSGYVEDIAEAIILCLEKPEADGRIFNVGHRSVLTAAQIARVIADEVDHKWEFMYVPVNALPFDNPFAVSSHILYDVSRICELGFRESCTHAGGLRKTVRWILKNQPKEWGYRKFYRHDPFDYSLEDLLLKIIRDKLMNQA